MILQAKVAKVVNWLAGNNVLAGMHSPTSKILVRPERIAANGYGEVSTNKMLRELKRIKLITDDRNITVHDLVVASLLPSYGDYLAKDSKERQFILKVVDRTIEDYFASCRAAQSQRARQSKRKRR